MELYKVYTICIKMYDTFQKKVYRVTINTASIWVINYSPFYFMVRKPKVNLGKSKVNV
jgi:hypothetical protein